MHTILPSEWRFAWNIQVGLKYQVVVSTGEFRFGLIWEDGRMRNFNRSEVFLGLWLDEKYSFHG